MCVWCGVVWRVACGVWHVVFSFRARLPSAPSSSLLCPVVFCLSVLVPGRGPEAVPVVRGGAACFHDRAALSFPARALLAREGHGFRLSAGQNSRLPPGMLSNQGADFSGPPVGARSGLSEAGFSAGLGGWSPPI